MGREFARFINSQIAEAFDETERAVVHRHFEAIQDHVAGGRDRRPAMGVPIAAR
jgi:hypothetical protein